MIVHVCICEGHKGKLRAEDELGKGGKEEGIIAFAKSVKCTVMLIWWVRVDETTQAWFVLTGG